MTEADKEFIALLTAMLIAIVGIGLGAYLLGTGYIRVTSGCFGSYDSYRICDKYGFNHCYILQETEWSHISPYVTTVHRFERLGNPSQVRNYKHHTIECLDSSKK